MQRAKSSENSSADPRCSTLRTAEQRCTCHDTLHQPDSGQALHHRQHCNAAARVRQQAAGSSAEVMDDLVALLLLLLLCAGERQAARTSSTQEPVATGEAAAGSGGQVSDACSTTAHALVWVLPWWHTRQPDYS
jgi:hypothetical protein